MDDSAQYGNINIDDLSEECRQIVDAIGLEALLALSSKFPGERIYIPEPGSLGKAARNRMINKEFNGRNYRDLAVKFGLTVRRIRSIISETSTKSARSDNQEDVYKQQQLF